MLVYQFIKQFNLLRDGKFNRLDLTSDADIINGAQSAFLTATEDIFEPLVMSFQNKDNVEKLNLQSVDLHHIFDKKLVNFYSNAIQNIIKENKHAVFVTNNIQ